MDLADDLSELYRSWLSTPAELDSSILAQAILHLFDRLDALETRNHDDGSDRGGSDAGT
jgi:hypothetical protein